MKYKMSGMNMVATAALLGSCLLAMGCAKRTAVATPPAPPAPPGAAEPARPSQAAAQPAREQAAASAPALSAQEQSRRLADELNRLLNDAYFDYDRYNLRNDAQSTLVSNGTALRQLFQQFPTGAVVIEGHADERGTSEYNMALADRRASTTKDYLATLGVPDGRVSVMPIGKERPQCTESSEDCWQRNRRVHFSPE
jgi:peptidoglycan-associated lipoprotein